MYREYKGNLFTANVQTLVNTVNCVGVMGKGVALEFRRRFPDMYEEYRRFCVSGELRPGQILPYRRSTPWILNFAVKDDWKHPSKLEWVEGCLRRFCENYERIGITSIAFPWIGAMNGRLPWPTVHALMKTYLQPLNIRVEVVEFDPSAPDPIFDRIVQFYGRFGPEEFAERVGITRPIAGRLHEGIRGHQITNLTELTQTPGLGEKTVDRLYTFFRHDATGSVATVQRQHVPTQARLWV